MRKVTEIQPLEHDRLETVYRRMTELIRDLIPADNIEFIGTEGSGNDETVLKQRRVFYDRCCEMMTSGKTTLRINRVGNFSYQGKRIQKFAPPDVQSFLGGVLEDDEGVLGYLCLADSREEFFSQDDEKLLKLLIERMSGLIRLARKHDTVMRQRDTFLDWLGEIQTISETTDPERTMQRIVEVLGETFDPLGVAIYWTADGTFTLQHSSEGIDPSRALPEDSPLVRRLNDDSGGTLVDFPRVQRMTSFDPPAGSNLMIVHPMRTEEGLVGFLGMFYREDPSQRARQFLEYGIPLLARNLEYAHLYASVKIEDRRDSVTGCPKYDPWKRSLNEAIGSNPDGDLVVWRFVVPEFELVVENRGLKRAEQWAKSIGDRITEEFSKNSVTRFHGTDFGGYSFMSAGKIESTIRGIREDVADWSFPAGRWPAAPLSGYEVFRSPFPDVETMIEAARRTLHDREDDENQRKEKPLDSVT